MQIMHRISIAANSEVCSELAALGIGVNGTGLVTFEIDEGSAAWLKLADWIKRRQPLDIVTTKFSRKEIDAATWHWLTPTWHHGYPQPNELEFGYRATTYDLTNYCERCGVGLQQKAPFQMKGEPRWGKNGILQLNWVFDEYFTTPAVWENVFRPHGIDCRLVLNTKGDELKTVVQLVTVENVGIVTNGLPMEEVACPQCRRSKYTPVTRAPFPALAGEPKAAMVKTKEYFGSGASAHRSVLVSQAIGRALLAKKERGASLWPVTQER